jgi:hypothetical protein
MLEFKGKCVIGIDLQDLQKLKRRQGIPRHGKLALPAIKSKKLIEEKRYKATEVYPTSTRETLQTPLTLGRQSKKT